MDMMSIPGKFVKIGARLSILSGSVLFGAFQPDRYSIDIGRACHEACFVTCGID